MRLQQAGEFAGEIVDLVAVSGLDPLHPALHLVQLPLQSGEAAPHTQHRRQDCRAGGTPHRQLFPLAPPGFSGRLQVLLDNGLHRRQLPVRQLSRRGGGGRFCAGGLRGAIFGRFLRRLRLHPQQGADGDAEDPAHGDEVLQLRHTGIRLPLAHRLTADAQPLPQGLLGEPGGLPCLLDAAAQRLLLLHGIISFAASTIPNPRRKRNHRRVSLLSTGGCGAFPQYAALRCPRQGKPPAGGQPA